MLPLFMLIFVALVAQATAGCPRIVSRAEWEVKAPKSRSPIGHPIPKVFIHHTESASCTTQADCSGLVRQFQAFHQGPSRNWDDIGYNFLVGEDGNAYEGRGWDLKGAHAGKWNGVSLGIAVIGSFTNSQPKAAALNTVKQIIECGIGRGKISGSYSLHGHRDGCSTDCPGNALYKLIKAWPHYEGRLSNSCG